MRARRTSRWERRIPPAAVCLALALAAITGSARGPLQLSVALTYELEPTLHGCPSEAEFRRAVAGQLGYDPFRSEAAHRVAAEVRESERGIEGELLWTDAGGNKEGERRLASPNRDCSELVRGMTFAIAVQIQLLNSSAGLDEAPAESAPSSSVAPVDAPIVEVRGPIVLPRESALPDRFVALGLGPIASTESAPSLTGGARAFGAVRLNALSLELGAQALLPVTLRQGDGTGFTTSSFGATLAPCGHVRRLALCAVGAVGRMRVEGFGVDDVRSPSSITAEGGLRLVFEQPLSARFALAVHADGLASLTSRTVYVNDMPVWTTRTLAFSVGIDLAVLFR